MDKWAIIIGAVLGTGGIGAILAFFVVPAPKRFESVEKRIAALEAEVSSLRVSNRFLTMGVTALTMHSDSMRAALLRHDPNAGIETAADVLKRVKANIDAMDAAEIKKQ